MRLILGPKQFVWALVEPINKSFIKHNYGEAGFQPINLIISQQDTKPVEIDIKKFPEWAQKQINSAVASRQLIDKDAKIAEVQQSLHVEEKTKGRSSGKKVAQGN